MSLQLLPSSFKELKALIVKYNAVPENDPIQQLFYLQKINAELNRTSLDADLFDWLYLDGANGWNAQLLAHNITPDASFMLKSYQFAQAVAKHHSSPHKGVPKELSFTNEYQILQERDALLATDSFENCREQYIFNCLELNKFSIENAHAAAVIKRQTTVLELSKAKFEAIRQSQSTPTKGKSQHHYQTKELSTTQGNNFNFKFTMDGWDKPFVFRVEDREDLGLEQNLHSYPVSRYFIEDFGVFMWGFEDKEANEIVYKPVFLCQFANQGNLKEIAQSLKNTNPKHYAGIISHYFNQLIDLCKGLIDAEVYHPDIKLTNFLIHGNRLLISDRKTLLSTETSRAKDIRSTPAYAPQEYLSCLTPHMTFNFKGFTTKINLSQFMAYQLGMALKEFITLTQRDEVDPDEFRDQDYSVASYFENPEKAIINLSTLIQELTREDASKRMSIKQMQELFKYRNHPPHSFNKEVERVLPSSSLGIQEDVDEIDQLIHSKLRGIELVKKSNVIFKKLSESEQKEPRLTRLAEGLAEKCFKEGSFTYFSKVSKTIESALLNEDWKKAPFYRKALHFISFGLYRVPRYSSVNSIKIDLDFSSDEFQMHFCQLEYTPTSAIKGLGKKQASNFSMFIFNHLNDISAPKNGNPEELLGETNKSSHQIEKTVHFSDPSGTVKIFETVSEKDGGTVKKLETLSEKDSGTVKKLETVSEKDSGTVKYLNTGSKVKMNEKEKEGSSLDSGSVVIKKDPKDEEQDSANESSLSSGLAAKNLLFFAGKKKHAKGGKFGTFRTTLFRGDSSIKLKASIEPPVDLENLFPPKV
jgi:hypothetical protein